MTTTRDIVPTKAIMVVDDETDIVFIFRKSLELAGYTAFAFTDPFVALEHLKMNANRYGLIISDVRMPNMNGIDFAARVREFDPTVSIILMSAFSMEELDISPDLKIAEMLQKPVTQTQLKVLVSKYLPIAQNADELSKLQ